MTDQEIIDVVQAHIEGKVIEVTTGSGVWEKLPPKIAGFDMMVTGVIGWDFQNFKYRVEPKVEQKVTTPFERAVEKYGYNRWYLV